MLGDEVAVQEHDGFPNAFICVAIAALTDSEGFDFVWVHLFSTGPKVAFW
jgi:hypothetical protein